MRNALNIVKSWCNDRGLFGNLNKTEIMVFIRSRKLHIDAVVKKAEAAFCACRGAIGKAWGLKPKVIYRLYEYFTGKYHFLQKRSSATNLKAHISNFFPTF